jgi:hypothetical protein
MKLGTENRTTTIVAIALMAIAAFMFVRMFTGGGHPASAANPDTAAVQAPPSPAPAPVHGRVAARGSRGGHADAGAADSLDPRLRLDLLKLSEDTEYKGAGRNIFRAEVEIPQPVADARKPKPEPPPPPPPPPGPPPIDLKFVGFASGTGEPTQVFLTQHDDIFVAKEGEIVNRRYKVMKINANSVEIQDLLSNNRQTIPLTAG